MLLKKIWMKRCLYICLGCICYLALLQLLIYAESFSEDPSITNIGEAVWFSLVTLTTVGYGDDFPTTPGGRAIGILFLLSSTGLLAFIIGMAVSLMTDRILPRLRLRRIRRHPWYVFSSLNRDSAALAANLEKEQPGAALIFCGTPKSVPAGQTSVPIGGHWHLTVLDLGKILRMKKSSEDTVLLIMGPDGYANYIEAQDMASLGIPVYCQTEFAPDSVPENLILFDRWDCCARLYWQQYPLARTEKQIFLVGCGRYGAALLERALLSNVYGTDRCVVYHVFGDSDEFRQNHPMLDNVVSVDGIQPRQDAVFFHKEIWNSLPGLLEQADRIILCMDSDEENMAVLQRIHRYFPGCAKPHMRLSHTLECAVSFGTDEAIFTPALVLRTCLNRLAMEMHEIYRNMTSDRTPSWSQLGDFLRASNLAAADHLLIKIRILLEDDSITEITSGNCHAAYRRYLETCEKQADFYREIEHIRWMRFYVLHNWRYAPKRDNERRCHPDIRPFSQLTLQEQAKDDYAWKLLGTVADTLDS